MSNRYRLDGGLGDVLVFAAALEKKGREENRVQYLYTNPILHFLFKDHPIIDITTDPRDCQQIKWPSQMMDRNLFHYHTMHRFAMQIGVHIPANEVFSVYRNEKQLLNKPDDKQPYILINQTSAEISRRYIPEHHVKYVAEMANLSGFNVRYIGKQLNSEIDTETDIEKMVDLLVGASLFVGPISFPYHLAACLRVPTVCFYSYMPYYKFSHFLPEEMHINPAPGFSCVSVCEYDEYNTRKRMDCMAMCKAVEYLDKDIVDTIEDALNAACTRI